MRETFNGAFGCMIVGFGATAIILLKDCMYKEACACLIVTSVLSLFLVAINRFAKE